MPIRKKGDIEIQTSANGTRSKNTGFTFYSYDKNSAALYFNFREENGEPTDLANATIRLVFVLNDEKITPKTDDIEIWLAVPGTARYIIPESMLGHEGKVTGYVYLEFSDGSHTDEGRFTFEIKQSMITDMLPEAGDKYVKDFEDIKAEVQEAADGAKETISQKVTEVSDTSDSAISKVNQVADDSRNNFNDSVERVNKAEAKAKSDMQDSVDQVNKDYEAWKAEQEEEQTVFESNFADWKTYQEKKQTDFESDTNETINGINTKVGETQTKISDLEKNLDVEQKNYFSVTAWENNASTDVVDNNILAVKLKLERNTQYTLSTNIPMHDVSSGETIVFFATSDVGAVYSSPNGVAIDDPRTITTNDDGAAIVAIWDKDLTSGDWWIMLNKGETAFKWTPASEDIVTKSELEQIKQAVINLGGEI